MKKEKNIHLNAKQLKEALKSKNKNVTTFSNWAEISRTKVYRMLDQEEAFSISDLLLAAYYFGPSHFDLPHQIFSFGIEENKDPSLELDEVLFIFGIGFSQFLSHNAIVPIPDILDIEKREVEKRGKKKNESEEIENENLRTIISNTWEKMGLNTSLDARKLLSKIIEHRNCAQLTIDDANFKNHIDVRSYKLEAYLDSWDKVLLKTVNILKEYYGNTNLIKPQNSKNNDTSNTDNQQYKSPEKQSQAVHFRAIASLFAELAKLNKNKNLFAFNVSYDSFMQEMFSSAPTIDHYSHFDKNGIFNKKWFPQSPIRKKDNENPKILLNHLFGSIAWFFDSDEEVYFKSEKARSTFLKSKPNEQNYFDLLDHNTFNQIGIKFNSSTSIKNNLPYLTALNELYERAINSKLILIWGYDLNEEELIFCLSNAIKVRKKNPFKLLFVDPGVTEYNLVDNIVNPLNEILKETNPKQKDIEYEILFPDNNTSEYRRFKELMHSVIPTIQRMNKRFN